MKGSNYSTVQHDLQWVRRCRQEEQSIIEAFDDDDQQAAVKRALSQFEKPEAIFVLSADAQCVASSQHAEFETGEYHAGFHITWTMTCKNPSKLQWMTTSFFNIFERAEEIEIEAIGNAGQAAIEFEKGQSRVNLSNAVGD